MARRRLRRGKHVLYKATYVSWLTWTAVDLLGEEVLITYTSCGVVYR